MKADKPNPEPCDTDGTSSNRALREEVERLRVEVAYIKKLEALVRANRQAAQKERKPSSS
jgi:transposase